MNNDHLLSEIYCIYVRLKKCVGKKIQDKMQYIVSNRIHIIKYSAISYHLIISCFNYIISIYHLMQGMYSSQNYCKGSDEILYIEKCSLRGFQLSKY